MNNDTNPADRGPKTNNEDVSSQKILALSFIRGVIGAMVGGTVGFFVFGWIASQGFYALVLPGALLGLGFGLASRYRSLFFGLFCAVAALCLGCYSEWSNFPWIADGSFSYFLTHLNNLKPVTLIMLSVGALMAFWFGRGR